MKGNRSTGPLASRRRFGLPNTETGASQESRTRTMRANRGDLPGPLHTLRMSDSFYEADGRGTAPIGRLLWPGSGVPNPGNEDHPEWV